MISLKIIREQYDTHIREYEANGEGCFIFEVRHPYTGKKQCLDATRAFGTYGRLVNHSPRPNLKAMVAVIDGVVRMGFLAMRDIPTGEELLVDYGQQRVIHPWLSRKARVRVN